MIEGIASSGRGIFRVPRPRKPEVMWMAPSNVILFWTEKVVAPQKKKKWLKWKRKEKKSVHCIQKK